jgi:hypothetical protein
MSIHLTRASQPFRIIAHRINTMAPASDTWRSALAQLSSRHSFGMLNLR